MRILDTAKRLLNVSKRDGIYVNRPVINAQEWFDWATKWSIPSPVPVDEMHVTVIGSLVDVKIRPATNPMVVCVVNSAFAMFGPAEDVLVVAFDDWCLWDRNWAFQHAGAVSTWPTYRPHMTISYAAAGFDISEDAMSDAPEYVMLGAEVAGPFKPAQATVDEEDPEGTDDGDDALTIVILEIACSAAKDLDVEALNPMDRAAVRDIAMSKPITKGVAKRLAKTAWAPDAIKSLAGAPEPAPAPAEKKLVEKTLTMTVGPMPPQIAEKLKTMSAFEVEGEQQIVYGWASVSTVAGEEVVDLQGDTITVKAQREWLHSLMRGQRSSTFEHEGDFCNEVVEGLVLDHALQKSLGIDLGMEGVIVGTHVPDPAKWEEVKKGDWMYSIAGTVLVEE